MKIQRFIPRSRAGRRIDSGMFGLVVPTGVQVAIIAQLNGVWPGLGDSVQWTLELGATALGPVTHYAGELPLTNALIKAVKNVLGVIPWFFVLNQLYFATNVVGLVLNEIHEWASVLDVLGLVEVTV